MRLTDASFTYLGDHDLLAPGGIKRGALTSNDAEDGDTKVSLLYWDEGFTDIEEKNDDGKVIRTKVQDRIPRFRVYDGLTEATIKRLDDGTFLVTGLSSAARGHGAFGPDEDRVDIKVVPGPNCVNCGHD